MMKGNYLTKKNTFFDFCAAAEHLISTGFTTKDHLYAYGASAGGLLAGAVFVLRPDLWRAVIADVPFVDVLTTMLDATIPLTTNEYDEWGNPEIEKYYWYMKSYSPYDNLTPRKYPDLLVTTGFHDSQVQYWEPAKFVAKLRHISGEVPGGNRVLFRTDMDTGHSGASGRFKPLEELALQYAFFLDLEKLAH